MGKLIVLKKSLLLSLIMVSLWVAPNLSYAQDQTIENTGSYLGVNNLEKPAQEGSKQEIKNNQTYSTINIQKQPEKKSNQKIGNHFSFFVVNIQINGKIKDNDITQ